MVEATGPTTGKTAATSLKLGGLNYSVASSTMLCPNFIISLFIFFFFSGRQVEIATIEAYDRRALNGWTRIYLFGGKSDLFPIVMRDFVDCASFWTGNVYRVSSISFSTD